MDRIDSNLEDTLTKVEMGNEKLTEAKKNLETGLSARIIRILLIANLLVFLLQVLRAL